MRQSYKTSIIFILLLIPVLSQFLIPQQFVKPPNWDAWKFLFGEWVGEGGGSTPGQASGGSKFYLDLQERILIRTNYAQFPATKDRPSFTHNDLMIIYQEAQTTRAVYYDNEGHVIYYTPQFSPDQNTLTFTGDIKPNEPRFRLTYIKEQDNKLKLKFEIAPPGKPEEFSLYLESKMIKK